MLDSPEIKAFRLDSKKQTALAKALAVPEMQEAIKLIDAANKPQHSMLVRCPQGLHPDAAVSREYHVIYGRNDALKLLQAMVKPPPMPEEQQDPLQDYKLPDPPELTS